MQNLRIADFADLLAWDLIHNEKNPDLLTAIVPSSINISNNSNTPSLIRVDSVTTTDSVILPLSNHSSTFCLMQVFKEVERHKLVGTNDRDDSGRFRRRRYCIGKCKRDAKTQYLCDHPSCRTFIYTISPNRFTGKYFCSTCFEDHKREVSNILGAMFSNL
jgi:hypothetical protein